MAKNREKEKPLRRKPRSKQLVQEVAVNREVEQTSQALAPRAAWILFAKSVAFILGFALPLLLVRRLSQHEFGLYKQVFLVMNTALSIIPLGFGMSVYYFLPRERQRQNLIVFNVVLFYLLAATFACVVLLLRPQLLTTLFNSPELGELAPLIGVAMLFWVLSSFLEVVAVAHQEARLATVFIIMAQFTKGALLIAAATLFGTVEALIYAAILQGIIQTLILFFYLRSRFPQFWREFDWSVMRRQLSYAIPLGLAGVLYTVQIDLHNYFVANHFDAATYAVYAIGCFQLPLVGILSESLASVMIPRVSLLQKQERRRDIIELTARVMRKLAALYFPLYIFLMITGREFITLLFTDRYLDSLPVFAINLTMLPFSILMLDPIMRAYANQRYFLLRLRLGLIFLLIVSLWFATNYLGLIGIISVVVVVSLIERFVTTVRMARVVGVTIKDIGLLKDIGKIALASLAAGFIALLAKTSMQDASLLVIMLGAAAIFSASYLLLFLLSGILTTDERELIRLQVTRLRRLFHKPSIALVTEGEGLSSD